MAWWMACIAIEIILTFWLDLFFYIPLFTLSLFLFFFSRQVDLIKPNGWKWSLLQTMATQKSSSYTMIRWVNITSPAKIDVIKQMIIEPRGVGSPHNWVMILNPIHRQGSRDQTKQGLVAVLVPRNHWVASGVRSIFNGKCYTQGPLFHKFLESGPWF